jgi:hypothetical protein
MTQKSELLCGTKYYPLLAILTMLRSVERLGHSATHAFGGKSSAETLRDAHEPPLSTPISVSIEIPTVKPKSRSSGVLNEKSTQDPSTPVLPVPPTPTSFTRKRITRQSILPIILPEDFPISALIRRAHIRRRKRVQVTRIKPLPPLPCARVVPPSRKPSQRSFLSIAPSEGGNTRPLPAIPDTITESNSESGYRSSSTGAREDSWRGGLERRAIASALKLSTDLCALQLKLEKHDEHFLYDPQLFPRPSMSTAAPSMSIRRPPTTALPIASSSSVTTLPIIRSPIPKVSSQTTTAHQRHISTPDSPVSSPSKRPLTHARGRSAQVNDELETDPGALWLTALGILHPPSSFRGVGRGGITKPDGTLTPTEYRSTSDPVRPPSRSSDSSSRVESEPAHQNRQHGARTHSQVLIDPSVPDTPVSGWFGNGPGRGPTPIDWELLNVVLGTKAMGRKSYCSVKTLESLEKEFTPRSRKDSSTTIESRSSRSRSRGRSKRKNSITFPLKRLSSTKWMPFGREEVPPLPPTTRT